MRFGHFHAYEKRIVQKIHRNVDLAGEVIEDATGAGDVFAAGFLTSMLVPGFEAIHGVELGLRMARSKLLSTGTSNFRTFPAIFTAPVDEVSSRTIDHTLGLAEQEKDSGKEHVVFIGHGRDLSWVKVANHLHNDL